MMDLLLSGGFLTIVLACVGLLWRMARQATSIEWLAKELDDARSDLKEVADILSEWREKVRAMELRQDKNFHELGSAWVQMKCHIGVLESRVFGEAKPWTETGAILQSQCTGDKDS